MRERGGEWLTQVLYVYNYIPFVTGQSEPSCQIMLPNQVMFKCIYKVSLNLVVRLSHDITYTLLTENMMSISLHVKVNV